MRVWAVTATAGAGAGAGAGVEEGAAVAAGSGGASLDAEGPEQLVRTTESARRRGRARTVKDYRIRARAQQSRRLVRVPRRWECDFPAYGAQSG
jgi:hypothetical protein